MAVHLSSHFYFLSIDIFPAPVKRSVALPNNMANGGVIPSMES